MLKFIPKNQRSKKAQKAANAKSRAPRPAIKLITVRHKSKKDYDRKRNKTAVKTELQNNP